MNLESILLSKWSKFSKSKIDTSTDIYKFGIKSTDIKVFLTEFNTNFSTNLKFSDIIRNRTIEQQINLIKKNYPRMIQVNNNTSKILSEPKLIEEETNYVKDTKHEIKVGVSVESVDKYICEELDNTIAERCLAVEDKKLEEEIVSEKKLHKIKYDDLTDAYDLLLSTDQYITTKIEDYDVNINKVSLDEELKWISMHNRRHSSIEWVPISNNKRGYILFLSACIEYKDSDNIWRVVKEYREIFDSFCDKIKEKKLNIDLSKLQKNKPIQVVYQIAHQLAISMLLMRSHKPKIIIGVGVGEFIGKYLLNEISLDMLVHLTIQSVYYLTMTINKADPLYYTEIIDPSKTTAIHNIGPNGIITTKNNNQSIHWNNRIYCKSTPQIMTTIGRLMSKLKDTDTKQNLSIPYISGSNGKQLSDVLFTEIDWDNIQIEMMNESYEEIITVCQHPYCSSVLVPKSRHLHIVKPNHLFSYFGIEGILKTVGIKPMELKSKLKFIPFCIYEQQLTDHYENLIIFFQNYNVIETIKNDEINSKKNIWAVYTPRDWEINEMNLTFLNEIMETSTSIYFQCKMIIDVLIDRPKEIIDKIQSKYPNLYIDKVITYQSTESVKTIDEKVKYII